MRLATLFLFLSVMFVAKPSLAQPKSDLDKTEDKFARYFEKVMPGWKHERVEPIFPSETVLIQFWSASERKVKVSIIIHKSANEAKEVLQEHQRYLQNKERLSDIGDEAFAGGYGSSDVSFRRGRYTVYVSTTAEIGARPEERMLNQNERFDLMKSEMRRWSREFAKHAAKALDGY